MKRTPLVRKTPLNRGTSQLKRTPLRRTAMKPWRRKPEDKLDPLVRAEVINRDGVCFIWRHVDPDHHCANEYGDRHDPYDVLQLTYEHVKKDHRTGKRAKSRKEFGVALCGGGNVAVPSAVVREKMRDHLRKLYPEVWASDEPG